MGSLLTPMTNERAAEWLLDRVGRSGDTWLRRDFVEAINRAAAAAEARALAAEAERDEVKVLADASASAVRAEYDLRIAAEAERDSLRALHRAATEEAVAEIGRLRGALAGVLEPTGLPTFEALQRVREAARAALASTLTVEVETGDKPDAPADNVPPCTRCGKDPRDLGPCTPTPEEAK